MRKEHPLIHVVRISDELFAEVQKHAEALNDDFDSALRKALGMKARNDSTTDK